MIIKGLILVENYIPFELPSNIYIKRIQHLEINFIKEYFFLYR